MIHAVTREDIERAGLYLWLFPSDKTFYLTSRTTYEQDLIDRDQQQREYEEEQMRLFRERRDWE